MSVEESKHPKRDLVADADLNVITRDIALGQILYLIKCLSFAANLKEPFAVNKEVSLRRTGHRVLSI